MKLLVIYEYDTAIAHSKSVCLCREMKDRNQQLDYKGENVVECEAEAAPFHALAL